MKKKLITGLFLLLILATVIGTFALAVDSYNYDMNPENGVDIFEGMAAVLILIIGGFVVLYELDLWYTVHYFLFREKTLAKSVLNLLSNLTFLSAFFTCFCERWFVGVKAFEITILIFIVLYILFRITYFFVAWQKAMNDSGGTL